MGVGFTNLKEMVTYIVDIGKEIENKVMAKKLLKTELLFNVILKATRGLATSVSQK